MDKIDMSLDVYKLFCTVVQTGNMSLAAKKLYISQPAVSMAIKQLEERFGKTLLVRSSKGIRTTPEGGILYEYASQGLRYFEMAEKKYFEMANMEMGKIRIGASDTILTYYLLPYIEGYMQKYGAIDVSATNRTTYETINLLKNGEVDIGFINLPVDEDDGIEIVECIKVRECIVGGSKYKHLAEKGISIKDINNYPLLMLEKESSTRHFIDNYAHMHGVILYPNIELGSNDLLINFAKINLGLTFAAREFVKNILDEGLLFEIPTKEPIPDRAIGLIKLKGVPLSYAANKFTDFLKL